jgi:hypothetical protein
MMRELDAHILDPPMDDFVHIGTMRLIASGFCP